MGLKQHIHMRSVFSHTHTQREREREREEEGGSDTAHADLCDGDLSVGEDDVRVEGPEFDELVFLRILSVHTNFLRIGDLFITRSKYKLTQNHTKSRKKHEKITKKSR